MDTPVVALRPFTPADVPVLVRGAYARLFWIGAVAAGGLVPVLVLTTAGTGGSAIATLGAATLALLGGAAWEYIWVEAGQSVPLS